MSTRTSPAAAGAILRVAAAAVTVVIVVGACAPPVSDEPEPEPEPDVYQPIDGQFVVGDERPVTVFVPSAYDPAVPLPLVLLLHGYGVTGAQMDGFLGFGAFADENNFIYARPDGNTDTSGKQFWNATEACCDFGATGVDDSGFLRELVAGARATANVDPRRVYVVGHSNGGFMAQRLACDHADVFAAVVSLAGASTLTPAACAPSEGVAVLEVHGTADETILYAGGSFGGPSYPSAAQTALSWAERNGCAANPIVDATAIDIDRGLAGAETTIERYQEGCVPGGGAELWTTQGGTHLPAPNGSYMPTLLAFLLGHPKP